MIDLRTKEVLTVEDISALFNCSSDKAYKIIREIRSTSDRLNEKGVVHIMDYIEHYKLPLARYCVLSSMAQAESDKNG